MHALKQNRIARNAAIVMILIMLSRVLGFIRERAIADVFGLNIETDLFRLAFNIPDLMYFLLIAGGLNAAFIPVFTGYLAKDEEKEAWKVATTFFTLIGLALVVLVTIGVIFTPQLSPLVAYGYTGDVRETLVGLMRLMFPAVFFTALAGAAMGIHKSYQRFSAPMWGPIAYNAVIIAATYVAGQRYGVVAMAYGTVIGAIVNFAFQLPFVIEKWRGISFKFDMKHPGIKQVFQLMGPAVISLSVFQINFIVLSNLASGLQPGSPTALRIAQTIVQLPLGVFAMAVSMVILPALSALTAQGKIGELRATFSKGLRAVFFVTIPSAVGLFILREPVVRLLFETGEFTSDDTRLAAFTLGFMTLGLWAQAGSQILTQVYYSLHQTKALVRISLFALTSNTLLAFLLLRWTDLGVGALALAYSVTAIITMFDYIFTLRRTLERIDGRSVLKTIVQAGIASGVMAGSLLFILNRMPHLLSGTTFTGQLVALSLVIAAGALVYFVVSFVFRMDELQLVKSLIQRKGSPEPETSTGP